MENTDTQSFRNGMLLSLLILITASTVQAAGLLFRIDIGNFPAPIAQEQLSGFDYMITEKADGMLNYRVGEFKDFLRAERARNDLKKRGFVGAETTAYFNDIEISMDDAFVMLDNRNAVDEAAYLGSAAMPVPELNRRLDAAETYFVVQVGVFSEAHDVESFDLPFEVQQIENDGGKFKYASSEYTDLKEVRSAKEAARANGVKDAFIVAYRDGKRIPMAEAVKAFE